MYLALNCGLEHVLDRLSKFESQYDLHEDDELWLMVDVDHNRAQFLSEMCQAAIQKKFKLAVSNPCFELWLILHITDFSEPVNKCGVLKSLLKSQLGSYNHANLDLSHYTEERIKDAIERAKVLHKIADERWPTQCGTHVYKVAELLMPHLRSADR